MFLGVHHFNIVKSSNIMFLKNRYKKKEKRKESTSMEYRQLDIILKYSEMFDGNIKDNHVTFLRSKYHI